MHDAHLACNGDQTLDGRVVTDLIVELRDSQKAGTWHFNRSARNIHCKLFYIVIYYP